MQGIAVLGFLAAVAPITATPGTSLTLVVSRVAAGGRRQGWWVILGTLTGLYVHATLAAVGLAALVMRSSQAFWVVKLLGAGYLVGLGLWLLWTATRRRPPAAQTPQPASQQPAAHTTEQPAPQTSQPATQTAQSAAHAPDGRGRRLPWRGHHPYLQGFLGNVLNPKAAAVYLTLAPQFLDADGPVLVPMLVLGTAHAVLAGCWLAGWTAISAAAVRLLRGVRVRRVLDQATGTLLVGLGIRTAVS
ncbi:LysE family translocator [Plantactinospora endophytica]|uniref:Lysine transporter LysE n=1 Tax=Plantactinospora endophytica TaxID=673535 RepID=A0ABQ4E6I5_9ACTN|nr:LysE family translocator [Plantactinospora endophytica]GIG90314.1 lysine transporter LysE [Plantactinospora endophytica]